MPDPGGIDVTTSHMERVHLPTRPASRGWVHSTRRDAINRILAAVLLLSALPVLLVLVVAVRLDSRGGAVFRQTRVGHNGRTFTIFKIRTMCQGAEFLQPALADANEAAGPLFKLRADPRVTRLGALLRKTSLDELPQLLNVVRGDMALVGPRPALPCEVAVYSERESHRLNVLPGVTGLWQVSGRSDLDQETAIDLDLSYDRGWTVQDDLMVLMSTVTAVVTGRGAY